MKKFLYRIKKIICGTVMVSCLILVFCFIFSITKGESIADNAIKGLIFLIIAIAADILGGFDKDI